MKKFYYLNNTCDHDAINIAGEILVVLDENKNVIYHHDWSDSSFEFPEQLPRVFMKKFQATYDSEFISLDFQKKLSKALCKKIEKYLKENGYEEAEYD
jgi:CRISPR/Cas system endoribonuclease Cas6 (RAMP superfamily)